MTPQEAQLHVLTEMSRCLAYAADLLAVDHPTEHDIDDAYIEVSLCFALLLIALKHQSGREVGGPQIESKRTSRTEPKLDARIDEMFGSDH